MPFSLAPSYFLPLSSPPLKKKVPSFSLFITSTITTAISSASFQSFRLKTLACFKPLQSNPQKSSVLSDSLRVLEWDKVCDSVASFAGTSLGREATKAQLWSVDVSHAESKNLLAETNAAVEMIKYGVSGMDFNGLDIRRVKSAIDRASRGLPVNGYEALAVFTLLQFADVLQSSLKLATKEDPGWYNRFLPLTEVIIEFVINKPFAKSVQQVVDEDGSVKDSASAELRRYRDQVRMLERKLHQLMDSLIRNESNETPNMEVRNIDGRWCIKSGLDEILTFQGLLLARC